MPAVFSEHDRAILRRAAGRVAEIAALPQMAVRRQRWVAHNDLQSRRPMMLIFPEGAFAELLPDSSLQCEAAEARKIEWDLRARIYTFEHFQDDTVIEAEWKAAPVMRDTGWGVEAQRHPSPEQRGAWAFQPVIRTESDLKKLHYPELVYDEAESWRNAEAMHDLFGDILKVRNVGVQHISYHLMAQYSGWCGLNEMLIDLVDRPDFVHCVLSFLTEGHRRYMQQLIDANLLSLNNDSTYHNSGGNGYTVQLPPKGYDPQHIQPGDMWGSAESQEFAPVSPRMHREFALFYEKQLLQPFGLTGYGCCEDLSHKLEDVLSIPNIRRVSISPYADVDRSAAGLKDKAIYSWKPKPAHLVGNFEAETIRGYIQHTLDATRENGCVLEMILKDTHTCEFHPERFDAWTQIARQCIREAGWED